MKHANITLQHTADYDRLWEGLFRGRYIIDDGRTSRRFPRLFKRMHTIDESIDDARL